MFHHLIVAVLENTQKQPLFSIAERKEMIRETTAELYNVEVDSFAGLLVDYAGQRRADVILRGIRAVSDYEAELQMALLNRRMRPETETIFLMSDSENSFISSRMMKEVISLGGDVTKFVPLPVLTRLKAKFEERK